MDSCYSAVYSFNGNLAVKDLTTTHNLDFQVRDSAAVLINTLLVTFGGVSCKVASRLRELQFTNKLTFLDTNTGKYQQYTLNASSYAPSPRRASSLTLVGQKLYVFGGYDVCLASPHSLLLIADQNDRVYGDLHILKLNEKDFLIAPPTYASC